MLISEDTTITFPSLPPIRIILEAMTSLLHLSFNLRVLTPPTTTTMAVLVCECSSPLHPPSATSTSSSLHIHHHLDYINRFYAHKPCLLLCFWCIFVAGLQRHPQAWLTYYNTAPGFMWMYIPICPEFIGGVSV